MSTLGQEQTVDNPEISTEPVQEQVIDWEKRYKDLQSFHDKSRVGWEKDKEQLRKQASVFVPPKTEEELATFKQDNPDWFGVIETVAHDIASNSIKDIKQDLDAQKEEAAVAQIRVAHPDVAEVTSSEDFNQWAAEQGPDIQSWLADTQDASKVIRALNYYKAMRSSAPQVSTAQPNTSAAQAVSTHGSVVTPQTSESPKRFSRAQINRMHPDEYEANIEAIKFAAQNGLITD